VAAELGYSEVGEEREKPFWERVRPDFPVTKRLIYLNHAAVAPLARPAAEAMRDLIDDVERTGSESWPRWVEAYEGLRVGAARLIGSHRDEIAILKNTSEGISTVANGLNWRAGDRVVCFREEFPANYFPWLRLERRGVAVTWLSIHDPLERIEAAVRGARLLAISFVNYLTGHRADLAAIGAICRRHGAFYFVDAIQGLGAFPLDVDTMRIDALSADGHKWLLGPEGCGILYVRRERLEEIDPVEFGWTNARGFADYSSRDMTLRGDAGRYECGTLNTPGIFGLRASIDYLNGIGVERIGRAVSALAERLAEGARELGYEVAGEDRARSRSGIVAIRRDAEDARVLVARLRESGMVAAPRQGWARLAPHFYLAPEEIERVIERLR
jgi:cysteine desulfurase/selenocysteine lyase